MITFDSIMLESFAKAESAFICGARVNKIQQPSRRELILSLRNNGNTRQFYINIDPKFYHVCFMSEENLKKRHIEIPQKPPMFCMLLRKYMNNARIAKINQPDGERILELYFETYNEIGDKIYLCLAVELMGKYSNIILYNCDTGIILGCAHNVGSDKSQVREVYGTIPYTYPPKQETNDFISRRYGFLRAIGRDIYSDGNINSIIDNYYAYHIGKFKYNSLKNNYKSNVSTKLKKVEKSLREMECQISNNKQADKYLYFGNLIMANLYALKDYSKTVTVFDYENNKNIEINLDETKTLKENANKFFKKYNKSKTSNIKLSQLIEYTKMKKEYLDSLLFSINCSENIDDLLELSEEIFSDEPIKKYDKKSIEPIKIESGETRIYIGKNNKQNDYIISKLADDNDLWFHVHNCAGSHVLLKTQTITDELILKCAKLAKEHSTCAYSGKAGVIYTKCKYLRKPPKAHLGYVTYKNEKEIVI